MKKSNRLLAFLLLLAFAVPSLSACRPLRGGDAACQTVKPQRFLYLFVGIDSAAENTDVMMTVGYDAAANRLTVVQIPRDTYFAFGAVQNKLNQYFASLRKKGKSRSEALAALAGALSAVFGVHFDGWFGLDTEAFVRTVDAMDGVDIFLESPVTLYLDGKTLALPAGEAHLDGAAAEMLVRSRKNYTHGDLDRLDAQKLFLSAAFERVRAGLSLGQTIAIAKALLTDAVTDIGVQDVVDLLTAHKRAFSSAATSFVTLPGKPLLSPTRLSYYVVSRASASSIVREYMFADGEFDPDRIFRNAKDPVFASVYDGGKG